MKIFLLALSFLILSFSCKSKSYFIASDGTKCIEMDGEFCVVDKYIETISIPPNPEIFIREFAYGYDYIIGKGVSGFSFEWGYNWNIEVMTRSIYNPDYADLPISYQTYEYLNTISKKKVPDGTKFKVEFSWLPNDKTLAISAQDMIIQRGTDFLYIDKEFDCQALDLCSRILKIKELIVSNTNSFCNLIFEFEFNDDPKEELILVNLFEEPC